MDRAYVEALIKEVEALRREVDGRLQRLEAALMQLAREEKKPASRKASG